MRRSGWIAKCEGGLVDHLGILCDKERKAASFSPRKRDLYAPIAYQTDCSDLLQHHHTATMLTTTTPILLLLLLLSTLTSALTLSEPFKPPDNHHHQHASSPSATATQPASAPAPTSPPLPPPAAQQQTTSSPPSLPPSTSQIDAFNLTSPTFATLSISGNDLDFFSLLNACIFRFYGPFSPSSCDSALKTVSSILLNDQKLRLRIRLILLEILNKIPWERHSSFFITVTGYARFFNENTTACDDVSFGIWDVSHTAAAAKLTRDIRGKMNDLVLKANDLIRGVIEEVNASFSGSGKRKKVVFVDHDSLFDGHRFCEPGVAKEPDYERRETWFFLPGGGDVDGEGRVYTSLREKNKEGVGYYYLDPERCWEEAAERGDWGEKAVCLMAKAKREDPGLRLRVHYRRGVEKGEGFWKGWTTTTTTKKPGDSMWLTPTYYGKTFHPRSAGHEAIRDKIFQVWEEHGYLKDQTDL
ncbi:hypothetical protein QC762_708025 [Podospora pseudocomata]|uniref:Uncharacterized protein n=1 Tax=Podospora pseudocomata TaxID=2093779 RepID=A0ABR0G442_9PEZI|nr:hypothetical protein QC762_708025 [Podospora pseudocomata]